MATRTTSKNIRPSRGNGGRLTPAVNRDDHRQSAGVRARARGTLATSSKARLAASSREFETSLDLICRQVAELSVRKKRTQTRIMWMGKAITPAFARQHLGPNGP